MRRVGLGLPLPPPRPAFSLSDRDAAPLRFLRALVITCEAAAVGLDHGQLAIPPVHAGESFRSLQLPDGLAVMFPTVGVLALAAILPALQRLFVEADDESVHGPSSALPHHPGNQQHADDEWPYGSQQIPIQAMQGFRHLFTYSIARLSTDTASSNFSLRNICRVSRVHLTASVSV